MKKFIILFLFSNFILSSSETTETTPIPTPSPNQPKPAQKIKKYSFTQRSNLMSNLNQLANQENHILIKVGYSKLIPNINNLLTRLNIFMKTNFKFTAHKELDYYIFDFIIKMEKMFLSGNQIIREQGFEGEEEKYPFNSYMYTRKSVRKFRNKILLLKEFLEKEGKFGKKMRISNQLKQLLGDVENLLEQDYIQCYDEVDKRQKIVPDYMKAKKRSRVDTNRSISGYQFSRTHKTDRKNKRESSQRYQKSQMVLSKKDYNSQRNKKINNKSENDKNIKNKEFKVEQKKMLIKNYQTSSQKDLLKNIKTKTEQPKQKEINKKYQSLLKNLQKNNNSYNKQNRNKHNKSYKNKSTNLKPKKRRIDQKYKSQILSRQLELKNVPKSKLALLIRKSIKMFTEKNSKVRLVPNCESEFYFMIEKACDMFKVPHEYSSLKQGSDQQMIYEGYEYKYTFYKALKKRIFNLYNCSQKEKYLPDFKKLVEMMKIRIIEFIPLQQGKGMGFDYLELDFKRIKKKKILKEKENSLDLLKDIDGSIDLLKDQDSGFDLLKEKKINSSFDLLNENNSSFDLLKDYDNNSLDLLKQNSNQDLLKKNNQKNLPENKKDIQLENFKKQIYKEKFNIDFIEQQKQNQQEFIQKQNNTLLQSESDKSSRQSITYIDDSSSINQHYSFSENDENNKKQQNILLKSNEFSTEEEIDYQKIQQTKLGDYFKQINDQDKSQLNKQTMSQYNKYVRSINYLIGKVEIEKNDKEIIYKYPISILDQLNEIQEELLILLENPKIELDLIIYEIQILINDLPVVEQFKYETIQNNQQLIINLNEINFSNLVHPQQDLISNLKKIPNSEEINKQLETIKQNFNILAKSKEIIEINELDSGYQFDIEDLNNYQQSLIGMSNQLQQMNSLYANKGLKNIENLKQQIQQIINDKGYEKFVKEEMDDDEEYLLSSLSTVFEQKQNKDSLINLKQKEQKNNGNNNINYQLENDVEQDQLSNIDQQQIMQKINIDNIQPLDKENNIVFKENNQTFKKSGIVSKQNNEEQDQVNKEDDQDQFKLLIEKNKIDKLNRQNNNQVINEIDNVQPLDKENNIVFKENNQKFKKSGFGNKQYNDEQDQANKEDDQDKFKQLIEKNKIDKLNKQNLLNNNFELNEIDSLKQNDKLNNLNNLNGKLNKNKKYENLNKNSSDENKQNQPDINIFNFNQDKINQKEEKLNNPNLINKQQDQDINPHKQNNLIKEKKYQQGNIQQQQNNIYDQIIPNKLQKINNYNKQESSSQENSQIIEDLENYLNKEPVIIEINQFIKELGQILKQEPLMKQQYKQLKNFIKKANQKNKPLENSQIEDFNKIILEIKEKSNKNHLNSNDKIQQILKRINNNIKSNINIKETNKVIVKKQKRIVNITVVHILESRKCIEMGYVDYFTMKPLQLQFIFIQKECFLFNFY